MSESLSTQTPEAFTPGAFPLRSQSEAAGFLPLDTATAAALAEDLEATPAEVVSPTFTDTKAALASKWRLIKFAPSQDGTVVLNLETWDLNPGTYHGLGKGSFRRSTIHQRSDGSFGYMGELDYVIHPMSLQSGQTLHTMLSEAQMHTE